jgi:large subunit ribosomal protein L31
MKADIHPKYHKDAKIICACGNEIIIGSTAQETHVEVCAKCHPFYTGKKMLVDTEGRVEKYKAKAAAKASKTGVLGKKAKTEKRAKLKAEKKAAKQPMSLVES